MPPNPKKTPYAFVLDALAKRSPYTRPLFGCTAVYVDEKIVFALREKETEPRDCGVWVATTADHHESLRKDFPYLRSIELFGTDSTGWQILPADAPDFEEAVLRACKFVLKNDPRIGKVPKRKKPKKK